MTLEHYARSHFRWKNHFVVKSSSMSDGFRHAVASIREHYGQNHSFFQDIDLKYTTTSAEIRRDQLGKNSRVTGWSLLGTPWKTSSIRKQELVHAIKVFWRFFCLKISLWSRSDQGPAGNFKWMYDPLTTRKKCSSSKTEARKIKKNFFKRHGLHVLFIWVKKSIFSE